MKICAGIVAFNPEMVRLKKNIESILPQVRKVFIVDNASNNCAEIKIMCDFLPNVELIQNMENLGIAAALNQLCVIAEQEGFDWILTLDQDTVVPDDLIKRMSRNLIKPNVGIICPNVYYEGWNERPELSEKVLPVYACMTSAALTSVSAWKTVGGFREDYFIDYVDNEFCMKLRINGYQILKDHSCMISHQLGDSRTKKILGILTVKNSLHSPWRYYYMIRNNRSFIREYRKHLPVFKEFLKLWYIIIRGVVFSTRKKETIKYIYMGYRDALKNRMGKAAGVY